MQLNCMGQAVKLRPCSWPEPMPEQFMGNGLMPSKTMQMSTQSKIKLPGGYIGLAIIE